MTEVRRLGPDDLPLFRAMNRLFGEAFEDPDAYGATPPDDAYVRGLLAHLVYGAAAALAAEGLGRLVGRPPRGSARPETG